MNLLSQVLSCQRRSAAALFPIGVKWCQTLPEQHKAYMPSLREWYDKLSETLHSAREDATLFDTAKAEIEKHLDVRRVQHARKTTERDGEIRGYPWEENAKFAAALKDNYPFRPIKTAVVERYGLASPEE